LSDNTRIYNRFKGYTVKDCDCTYCLYYVQKSKSCSLEKCCCENERNEAIKRERAILVTVEQEFAFHT
jgi:hypothetical protein